jgi:hypothetical protein
VVVESCDEGLMVWCITTADVEDEGFAEIVSKASDGDDRIIVEAGGFDIERDWIEAHATMTVT